MKKIICKILFYIVGLFIVTLGIATCIKSGLGVSPVTSVPRTVNLVTNMSTGVATILFYCLLVVLQIVLLRKNFKLKNLLQIPVAILFGYFTDFSIWLLSATNIVQGIFWQFAVCIVGILLVAVGMFFYVPTDIVPLPPDGTIKTVAELAKMKFPNVKIIYDVTSVSISLIVCIFFLKPFDFANMSVGIGTVLAAVFVGLILGFLNKWFGKKRDLFIK